MHGTQAAGWAQIIKCLVPRGPLLVPALVSRRNFLVQKKLFLWPSLPQPKSPSEGSCGAGSCPHHGQCWDRPGTGLLLRLPQKPQAGKPERGREVFCQQSFITSSPKPSLSSFDAGCTNEKPFGASP